MDKIRTTVKLTARGFKLLLASIIVLTLGVVFKDLILVGAAISAWVYLSIMYRQTGSYMRKLGQVKVSPGSIEGRLTAGKTFSESLHVASPIKMGVTIHSPLRGASLRPDLMKAGDNTLQFSITPSLSGVYECETLEARTFDRFSLIEGSGEIQLKSSFKVHPRVYSQAMEALEFLHESGYRSEGTYVTRIRGRGLEYAESRDYVPGDAMDVFDWKATARMGKPFVKQFFVEGGGGIEIVYDPVVPDPVSLDELNAAFLELAVSTAKAEAPVKLSSMDGHRLAEATDPRTVVEAALRIALEGHLEEFKEYYSLLEPAKMRHYDKIVDGLHKKKMRKEAVEQGNYALVVLSSLSRDQAPTLSLIQDRQGYTSLVVIQPTTPWIWGEDLEASLRKYVDNRKKMRVFEKMRVKTHISVTEFISEYRRSRPAELVMA